MTDLGIAQIKNHNFEMNKTLAIENVVYNELLTRGYDVYVGKTQKGEIDFIARKDNYSKYVITLDKMNFSRDGIIHMNMLDFLMQEDF